MSHGRPMSKNKPPACTTCGVNLNVKHLLTAANIKISEPSITF